MVGAEQWSAPSSDSQRTRSEVTDARAFDALQRSQQPSPEQPGRCSSMTRVSNHESHGSTVPRRLFLGYFTGPKQKLAELRDNPF